VAIDRSAWKAGPTAATGSTREAHDARSDKVHRSRATSAPRELVLDHHAGVVIDGRISGSAPSPTVVDAPRFAG
jgi:hypothetical protein